MISSSYTVFLFDWSVADRIRLFGKTCGHTIDENRQSNCGQVLIDKINNLVQYARVVFPQWT